MKIKDDDSFFPTSLFMLILRIKRDSVVYIESCICKKRKSMNFYYRLSFCRDLSVLKDLNIFLYNMLLHLTASSESFSKRATADNVFWFINS
ncbi:MAG: hypothetical protein CMD96_06325 [Gammaproteobacteria bacterium]|nr:hypothetical protein [Gammaproteobacteria bacterium]